MDHYAGIDVSLEQSSICIVDATGRITREAKVASEPDALVDFLRDLKLPLARIGLEAGPLSQWLHAGLQNAGFAVVLLETRHVIACGWTARTSAGARRCRCRPEARGIRGRRRSVLSPLRGPVAGTQIR